MANDIAQRITALTELAKAIPESLLAAVDDPNSPGKKTKKLGFGTFLKTYNRLPAEISEGLSNDDLDFKNDFGNASRYGASPSASAATNDTGIENAILVVRTAGGGDVIISAGDYDIISVDSTWTSTVTVNIRGEGKFATILRKSGATTTPVLNLSAASLQESHSSISDLRIIGNAKAHDGLKVTLLARFDVSRVRIDACDVALNSVGSLVFSVYDPSFQSNNIGYKCRKSGTITPNLVQFFGGNVSANTTFGLDLGDTGAYHNYGTDISGNGTAADLSTGAVVIRDTVDDGAGLSNISFNGTWFESNLGMTIKCEDATELSLAFNHNNLIGSESGNVMDIGAIRSLTLNQVIAATAGDTIITGAADSLRIGGTIAVYTDNSTKSSITIGSGTELQTQQLRLVDGTPDPTTVSGFATIYIDDTDGDLKVRFGNGDFRTIQSDAALATYTPTNVTTDRVYDANAAVNGTGIDVAAAGPANVALLSDHDALVAVVQEYADVLGTLIADLKIQGTIN